MPIHSMQEIIIIVVTKVNHLGNDHFPFFAQPTKVKPKWFKAINADVQNQTRSSAYNYVWSFQVKYTFVTYYFVTSSMVTFGNGLDLRVPPATLLYNYWLH